MPIDASLIGSSTEVRHQDVDARWTMAYSASLGDTAPCYLDTTGEVVAHPMFTIAPEWAVQRDGRALLMAHGLTPDEELSGVHATHDCHPHRLVRPGDRLATRSTLVLAERRRPGAYLVTRLDTTDAEGAPVCTTYQASLYRGVEIEGGDRVADEGGAPPPLPAAVAAAARGANGGGGAGAAAPSPVAELTLDIPANLAHVYSECARIWSPIHTDEAVARRMGLPGTILHGSATLALAVSGIVEYAAGGDPRPVRRLGGMFRAMVKMPSRIRVRVLGDGPGDGEEGRVVVWEVLNAAGETAIAGGYTVFED